MDKHKGRRDHFEDLLNDSIRKENEWAKRALAAEEALRDLRATTRTTSLRPSYSITAASEPPFWPPSKLYGQPGASEPGAWLAMAKEALGVVTDGMNREAGEKKT